MYGRLIDAWPYSWEGIWAPLEVVKGAPLDLFMQLYAELQSALILPVDSEERGKIEGVRASIANDPDAAKQAFIDLTADDFRSDPDLAEFFETAFLTLNEYNNPLLVECYRTHLSRLLRDLNLRFRLTSEDILVPHISGIVTMLRAKLDDFSRDDPKLTILLNELDNSLANLSRLPNQANAKGWITRSSVFTEGLAQVLADSTQPLGKLCRQGDLFPHKALAEALSQLYGFCSDYVGLRHAGNIKGSRREVDFRDAVSVAVILLGLSSYFMPTPDFPQILGIRPTKQR